MNKKEELSDYQAFVRAKHERCFNTPHEILEKVVAWATGDTCINKKERIIKGEANEVYSITTSGGNEVIVRISHVPKSKFKIEKWAIQNCAYVGVPVPAILLVDTIKHKNKRLHISVESKLPGVPMDEVKGISKGQLENLLYQAGAILAKIHSVKTSGYGDLSSRGVGSYKSAKGAFFDLYIAKNTMLRIAASISLDKAIIARAFEILEREFNSLKIKPRLTHGDFGPKHLFVSKGKICGVIDFENAESTDPLREFARWDFYFASKYPVELLKKGYASEVSWDNDFEKRVYLWKLHTGLNSLRYYFKEKNPAGIKLCKLRLIEGVSREGDYC